MSDQMRHRPETGPSHLWVEVGVALFSLAFGLLILVGSIQVGIGWAIDGPQAGFFPFYVSLFIIVGSLINLMQATRSADAKQRIFSSWDELWRVMSVVLPTSLYVALVPFIGMYVASGLLIAVFMIWLGGYGVWKMLPVAIGIPVIAYIVFERYFQIALPKGPFEDWLGL